eukprot:TRINITY_DN7498_c0_g1_i1.p1 TRINITY_DN7498_c0_g1~~TRINITY_DN7498_c0_g1_i1.p1  ORF type:complete len:429 (+),score=53.89 TRINITY_DN7498_c0_g1_i1:68-1354(+)
MFDDDWSDLEDRAENFKTKLLDDEVEERTKAKTKTKPKPKPKPKNQLNPQAFHLFNSRERREKEKSLAPLAKELPQNPKQSENRRVPSALSFPEFQPNLEQKLKQQFSEEEMSEEFEIDSDPESDAIPVLSPEVDDLLVNTPPGVLCSVCDEVFKTPLINPRCAHTFCKKCIEAVLNTKNPNCPLCRGPFPQSSKYFLPNHQLTAVIDSLSVRCKWGVTYDESSEHWVSDPSGCQSVITLDQFELHSSRCQYALINCTNSGCPKLIRRHLLQNHVIKCRFRKVTCRFCCCQYEVRQHREHVISCPDRRVDCPLFCGDKVIRKNLSEHFQRKCLNAEVPCPHKDLGCDFIGKRLYHLTHSKVCLYDKLKVFFINNRKEVERLEKKIDIQGSKIKRLEILVEQQAEELRMLKRRKNRFSFLEEFLIGGRK